VCRRSAVQTPSGAWGTGAPGGAEKRGVTDRFPRLGEATVCHAVSSPDCMTGARMTVGALRGPVAAEGARMGGLRAVPAFRWKRAVTCGMNSPRAHWRGPAESVTAKDREPSLGFFNHCALQWARFRRSQVPTTVPHSRQDHERGKADPCQKEGQGIPARGGGAAASPAETVAEAPTDDGRPRAPLRQREAGAGTPSEAMATARAPCGARLERGGQRERARKTARLRPGKSRRTLCRDPAFGPKMANEQIMQLKTNFVTDHATNDKRYAEARQTII
jgi:hypothetical protein